MAKDATAQAANVSPALETFIVVNGTLLHDGQTFLAGTEFQCGDAETVRDLLACRAIARPAEAMQAQITQTLDENASLRTQVRDLEREIAEARATIEKRERVM